MPEKIAINVNVLIAELCDVNIIPNDELCIRAAVALTHQQTVVKSAQALNDALRSHHTLRRNGKRLALKQALAVLDGLSNEEDETKEKEHA